MRVESTLTALATTSGTKGVKPVESSKRKGSSQILQIGIDMLRDIPVHCSIELGPSTCSGMSLQSERALYYCKVLSKAT